MSFSSPDDPGEIDDYGNYEIILPPEPPVWGVSHIAMRNVPDYIEKPPYALPDRAPGDPDSDRYHGDPYHGDGRIELGSESERRLRRAGALAKRVLKKAGELAKVGITTNEIDAAIHDFIIGHGAYPSPLRYAGFPKSCCTSVNNVVVHGIPDDRKLVDGDIVNIDITVFLEGFHGDTSQTFLIGDVDPMGRELVQATSEALDVGIHACGPGVPFKAVGAAIHAFAKSHNLSISEQFTGHGIDPSPPQYPTTRELPARMPMCMVDLAGSVRQLTNSHLLDQCQAGNDEPGTMLPGHCFTIEPALIIGRDPRAWIFPDGWTASTMDGCRSAQAEHMVLVTETGVDVITR